MMSFGNATEILQMQARANNDISLSLYQLTNSIENRSPLAEIKSSHHKKFNEDTLMLSAAKCRPIHPFITHKQHVKIHIKR